MIDSIQNDDIEMNDIIQIDEIDIKLDNFK